MDIALMEVEMGNDDQKQPEPKPPTIHDKPQEGLWARRRGTRTLTGLWKRG